MFTTSMTQHIDRISHALQVSIKYAFDSFSNPLSLPLWVPTARNREFRSVMQFMDGLMYGLLAERRQTGAHHDDLLDLLLHARDEETGAGLSDQELRDETLTIFAAGHETTANAIAWTWYLLATHPETKARFHEELDRVLQGRTPNAEDLEQLSHIHAPSSMNLSVSIHQLRRSTVKRRRTQRSGGCHCQKVPSSWSAHIICTDIKIFGHTLINFVQSDGWMVNEHILATLTCRSGQDREPVWAPISPRWKGHCCWR